MHCICRNEGSMEKLDLMPVRTRIAATLRKAIYTQEIPGGSELSLTDVAAELGVSRTPVREAFQELAAEGLLTLRMNRGAIVESINRKFIRDIFEMRILLEGEAAGRAAHSGMDTEPFLSLFRDWAEKELKGIEKAVYEEKNQMLHMAIWKAADNARMQRCLMDMWNGPSIGRDEAEERLHYITSTQEHIGILEAIRDRKEEAAREQMRGHIERSMQNILKLFPA